MRDRHPAAETEGAACYLDSGRGLRAFVFVEIDAALNPAHRFFVEAARDDVARAQVFLDVKPQDFVEHVVGRQRILIDLAGFQFGARRFFDGRARNDLAGSAD